MTLQLNRHWSKMLRPVPDERSLLSRLGLLEVNSVMRPMALMAMESMISIQCGVDLAFAIV